MCTDIIKILKFVLIVLKENDKTAFKGSGVYDIYRQFFRVAVSAEGVLTTKLKWKIETINSDTSFGSAEKKWLYFNNQHIREYEENKHKLLRMFSPLESEGANPKYEDVFRNNFLSKSINGRIDEHSTVAHIDENFQLIVYHFNLVTNAKEVKPLRNFDKLFTEVKFDLSTQEKRESFIQETKPQIEELRSLLGEYEKIMAQYYTINDLFLQ
jgi:hypothetical protein